MLSSGFELVKENRLAKIFDDCEEKDPSEIVFAFCEYFMKNAKIFN